MSDGLMTIDEFNAKVKEWSKSVKNQSYMNLSFMTESSGTLARSLKDYMGARPGGPAYKVKFAFNRYGVFRAYGTGRGYKREGGMLVKRLKIPKKDDGVMHRSPLDWLDGNIQANVGRLADICQVYYGDSARERLLADIDKMKIIKK